MGRRKKRRTPSPPSSPEEIQYSVGKSARLPCLPLKLHLVLAEVIKASRKVNGEWVRPPIPLSFACFMHLCSLFIQEYLVKVHRPRPPL